MIKYPPEILKMQSLKGFHDVVLEYRYKQNMSAKDAFYKANDLFYDYFERYRYSDFSTYNGEVSRRINKLHRLK